MPVNTDAVKALKKLVEAYQDYILMLNKIFPKDKRSFDNFLALGPAILGVISKFSRELKNPADVSDLISKIKIETCVEHLNIVRHNWRPDWDEYFLILAMVMSLRASCYARKVGAVFVQGKHIIDGGYNGAPPDITSCMEMGACYKNRLRQREMAKKILNQDSVSIKDYSKIKTDTNEYCKSPCSERSTLKRIKDPNIIKKGMQAYLTLFPCIHCAREMINKNVNAVYYLELYESSTGNLKRNQEVIDLFAEKNIPLVKKKLSEESYLAIIFNLIHPEGISRPLMKPNEDIVFLTCLIDNETGEFSNSNQLKYFDLCT